MESYEIVVVGAGPAGGQCARELAAKGRKVLLVEKCKDFSVNNFSSGGAPQELMSDYKIPLEVVGASWNKILFSSSHNSHVWEENNYKGVVLDFKKFRSFLANEVMKHGSKVELNTNFHHFEYKEGKTLVYLRDMTTHAERIIETKVIVDATGTERKVLQKGCFDKTKAVAATGIEYLMEIDDEIHRKYANQLAFYMGSKWMPQGYAWVFPMDNNLLKVGVIRYFSHDQVVPHEPSYRHYLDQLVENCIGKKYSLLDTHGKTIHYVEGQREPRYSKNVIAIGDSISTLNPMASEGIRHAMYSSRVAASAVQDFLNGNQNAFKEYSKEMSRYFGYRWKASEYVMNTMYREKSDKRLADYVKTFSKFNFAEMLDFCFNYNPKIIFRFFWNHFFKSLLG